MRGKAFRVIPGPLHVPSGGGGKRKTGCTFCACAYVCVGLRKSGRKFKPWDPLLHLLTEDKDGRERGGREEEEQEEEEKKGNPLPLKSPSSKAGLQSLQIYMQTGS